MEVLSSSLRVMSPENTLRSVRLDAARLGVTRVTDITRLDVIGIPAFSSVRGDADSRSLHVHNGKGVRAIEAKVGAYAEAIEFALADPTRIQLQTYKRTVRYLVSQESMKWDFIDYCPLLDADVSQNTEL